MNLFRETWSRDAVGYRQGEFEGGDGVAATVVTLIGGPALIVGTALVTTDRLSLGQILLLAPLAALMGGVLVGSSAAMAAQTGANSTWLLRPSFGRAGAVVVSLVRLIMVALWAVIGLQLAGGWLDGAAASAGITPAVSQIGILVITLFGVAMAAWGLVPSVRVLIRRPLFVASVFLLAVLAWRLAGGAAGIAAGGEGSFWRGVQRAVEMSVVFIPFVQTVARRLHNDEEAMTGFGVGYAVPATLMVIAGAIITLELGGIADIAALDAGTMGAAVAGAWVLIAELDQAFSSFVAAGSESVGILRWGPAKLVGLLTVVGVVAIALSVPDLPITWASFVTAAMFPAALIAVADFHLTRDRYYTEADIYGGTEGLINVPGIVFWLLAFLIGQILDPIGPSGWVEAMPGSGPFEFEVPWRLIVAVVAAVGYVLVTRWHHQRSASVYELRGV